MKHAPAAAGIAGIVASAVIGDVWAIRTGRPTISATVATSLEHSVAAPIVIGTAAGLGWHLLGDPIVRWIIRHAQEHQP